MSNNGQDDPPKDSKPSETPQVSPKAAKPPSANQLFGHKGGAKPWDKPPASPLAEASEAQPPASKPNQTSASSPLAATRDPRPASSAPYPRDAQYTPRPEPVAEPAPTPFGSSILGEVDDESELTKLHPNYKFLMRFGAIIWGLILVVAAIVADEVLSSEFGWPFGLITGPVLLLALFLIIRIPNSRYNARGYQISRDRLRVVRGILWHSDTVVPFGRVQHIDVDQGPIERAMGIATMTLHTAGSHNASVQLPGLGHELAVTMREEIRAHIKRETM